MDEASLSSPCRKERGNGTVKTVTDMLLYFLIAATVQNLVLTTGFGCSVMIKIVRRPEQLFRFGKLLLLFSLCTTALFFPVNRLLPDAWFARMLRPLLILIITALLYLAFTALASRSAERYRSVRHILPLAVFNNIVIGITLLINYQVSVPFLAAIGIAAGGAVSVVLLSALTAEAIERLDNPDTPQAFRGLPATLVYLGLLAMALMGFQPTLNLI